jgi:RNA polymerase sigma-70 factor (ECF subfamily)
MRTGDLHALDRLTRCYGQRLLAVGRRYCRDEEDAKDAVQDALLGAGEHLTDFRGEGTPEGWLVRMVANACRRMSRGRKNDPGLHRDIEDTPVSDVQDGPERLAHRGELVKRLGEVLVELPAKDRTILLLSEAEEWTAPEIGETLGMSANAVRIRLSRLRAKLRPQLSGLVP